MKKKGNKALSPAVCDEVLVSIAAGDKYKDIAERLKISISTVCNIARRNHVCRTPGAKKMLEPSPEHLKILQEWALGRSYAFIGKCNPITIRFSKYQSRKQQPLILSQKKIKGETWVTVPMAKQAVEQIVRLWEKRWLYQTPVYKVGDVIEWRGNKYTVAEVKNMLQGVVREKGKGGAYINPFFWNFKGENVKVVA